MLALTLLSLGGLPPLLGFIPKFLILLIRAPLFIPPLILMLGRYINIYYYISIMWLSFITRPQPLVSVTAFKTLIAVTLIIISIIVIILICGLNIHL
jgi:NADH:ubiquinone oxidoreductase subunit 2 (subunit N)